MIGSLMSRMGMAEKLSVAQLQKAVQDGTLPAYIGVPLMQDKMQQEKTAQAAAAGAQQQGQPPIAQQVMQEAQAQEQARGLEQAQSNLPQEYAQGGIIGYALGGNIAQEEMDEQDDDEEEARLYGTGTDNDLIQAIAAAGRAGPGGAGIQSIHPSAAVSMFSNKEKEIDKNLHKYGSQGIDAAKRIGLNPSLMMHVMQKETGGLKNPEEARSSAGAQGVMQFMPATAKQYGINPNIPEEAIPAGAKHLYGLVNHYKGDEKLAAMAYNWGQGNVDKWLKNGADPRKIPKETRNYVADLGGDGISKLAEGGEVKRYDLGGLLSSVVETPMQQIQSAGNTYSKNPEQALLGINTPAEAYVWNSALGTHYSPTANMLGGPTQAQYAEGAKNGMNMQAGHIADSVAPAVIGAFTAGVGGAGASAGNALGNQYELNQMRGQYFQNPTAFQNQYGMVKGVNYAEGGITSIPRFAGEGPSLVGPTGELMEDYLASNPETIPEELPPKKLSDVERMRATQAKEAKDLLARNAQRAAEMKGAPRVPIGPAAAAEEGTLAMRGLRALRPALTSPVGAGIVGIGSELSDRAARIMGSPAQAENRQALQDNPMLGAMSGDTAFASAIMDAADQTPPKSTTKTTGKPEDKKPAVSSQPASNSPTGQDWQNFDQASALYQAEQGNKDTPPSEGITQLSASDRYAQAMEKSLLEQAEEAKKNHEMNKYLALMQAGFGMMGSKALVPLQAMGEGAQQGVGAYANLLKGESEDRKLMASQQAALYRTAAAKEYRDAMLGTKRSPEDLNQAKADQAYAQQVAAVDKAEAAAAKAAGGELSPFMQQQYEQRRNQLREMLYKQYKVPYNPIKLEPIRPEPVKVEPSTWQKIAPSALGGLSKDDLAALDWANNNPQDPRSDVIKQRLGK